MLIFLLHRSQELKRTDLKCTCFLELIVGATYILDHKFWDLVNCKMGDHVLVDKGTVITKTTAKVGSLSM